MKRTLLLLTILPCLLSSSGQDYRTEISAGNNIYKDTYDSILEADVLIQRNIINQKNSVVALGNWPYVNIISGMDVAPNISTTSRGNDFGGNHTAHNFQSGYDNFIKMKEAGYNLVSGQGNVWIGPGTGYSRTSSLDNIYIGRGSGRYSTSGNDCVYIGYKSGDHTNGSTNIGIGNQVFSGTGASGTGTIALGANSLMNAQASSTVSVGNNSGIDADSDGSVFLGPNAGTDEDENYRLHIANSAEKTLIYGKFDENIVCIDHLLQLKPVDTLPDAVPDGTLGIRDTVLMLKVNNTWKKILTE